MRELREKLSVARREHTAAAARMQQLQQRLALQVKEYHQHLFTATEQAARSVAAC